jgi:hypothetical protein
MKRLATGLWAVAVSHAQPKDILAMYSEWQRTHDERLWKRIQTRLRVCSEKHPSLNLRGYFSQAF